MLQNKITSGALILEGQTKFIRYVLTALKKQIVYLYANFTRKYRKYMQTEMRKFIGHLIFKETDDVRCFSNFQYSL